MLTSTPRRVRALLALAAAALALTALPARAEAPAAGTPAPGFARMKLGAFEVTALSDGIIQLPLNTLLKNITPARVDTALGMVYLREPVPTSVNAYLINTGTKLILVDTGAGTLFGPTLGKLMTNLKAAGYEPEAVDEILITHFHPDHIGGLTNADGTAAFPNAVVRADAREARFWLSDAVAKKMGPSMAAFFAGARKSLAPYVAAKRLQTFTGSVQLEPGIRSLSSIGHTAGHASYLITSGGARLAVWGDLIHAGALQFPDPDITITYDSDATAATAMRKRAFAEAATTGEWVAAAHLSFPGIGHVGHDARGYRWIPANYQPVIGAK